MFKLKKIKLKKIKNFLKSLPRTLGENAFLTFLGLLFVSLILGAFIFYQYSFLIGKEPPTKIGEGAEKPLKFKEKTYQNILKIWQEKEERFKETDLKEYSNPFKG